MLIMQFLPLLLLASTAHGGVVSRRQRGKVDAGTAPDCTAWDDVDSSSKNWCQYFLSEWGLSRDDFLSWNPGISKDCTGFKPGNSYCVEVNFGLPRETTQISKTTSTKPAGTPTIAPPVTTTAPPKPAGPSPAQPGIPSDCSEYYKASKGDDCSRVAGKFGISLDQFYAWNPPVGTDCKSLWLDYYYCVKRPGSAGATIRPTATVAAGGVAAPTPTQPGSQCNCRTWHKVVGGDSCWTLQQRYGVRLEDIVKWNPGVGADCLSMWLQYYVCVEV